MKKIFSLAILSLFYVTGLQASGINVGVSLSGSVFELDGASEDFKAGHVSNVDGSAAVSKKASSEGENAEGAFVLGSVFLEKEINDKFTIGLDYVPMSMESETSENVQQDGPGEPNGTEVTNKVQVDFEKLTTLYGMINLNENVYLKVGMMSVDVKTNETLNTGGAYGDTSLDGYMLGLGYDRDLSNGSFLRLEANYMDLDGVTLVNANDSDKSVSADGISGYGARVSIGKSF
tara:strand:- start:1467 stop:2165 length:699 start_codon:yes stop_codon:yes gene_type:complete